MESEPLKPVVIDASTSDAADLRPLIAQILCAANPARHGIGQIRLYTSADDRTDWPEAPWLQVLYVDRKDQQENVHVVSKREMVQDLAETPEQVLLSLNSEYSAHALNLVLMSDKAASLLSAPDKKVNLLARITSKRAAFSSAPKIDHAAAVIGFSCSAVARLSVFCKSDNQRISAVPLGIAPEFFHAKATHPLIEQLAIDRPFMWITAATSDDVETTLATVDAVKILRDYGAFMELKLLLADELSSNTKRQIEKAVKNQSFVELIDNYNEAYLAEHYQASDGFIWGTQSDCNHKFLLYAMASGLPVISAHSEMIKKHLGNNIRFFEAHDPNDLANTLERSTADIHFRIVGGARNHKKAMAYTWEKTAAELFRLIKAYGNTSTEQAILAS